MKMSELSRMTGITKYALHLLYHERVKAIRFDTLDKICRALSCQVGELLEYQTGETKSLQGLVKTAHWVKEHNVAIPADLGEKHNEYTWDD